MKSENKRPVSSAPQPSPAPSSEHSTDRRVLSPGQWIRAVHGVTAPFGYDRMPTVFG